MGQANNRGTRDERVKQAQTRPEKEATVVKIRDVGTTDLIRLFSRTLIDSPSAISIRAEINFRVHKGDPMCIQFVKDIPKLKARSSARAQSNVNMWIVDYQRGM